jgi:hypothetical protein
MHRKAVPRYNQGNRFWKLLDQDAVAADQVQNSPLQYLCWLASEPLRRRGVRFLMVRIPRSPPHFPSNRLI